MKLIKLRTASGLSKILIGRNLLPQVGRLMRSEKLGKKVLIVSNRHVSKRYMKPVRNSLKRSGFETFVYLLPNGDERDKSERVLCDLWAFMSRIGLERTSTLVAVGGGVVGDISGFAASTYVRGIALVQIPTTLLAQVDSAIGGKTAINLKTAKNIVGTFHQPRLVVSDVMTLTTQRQAEFRNSFAEVIKYGVIKDAALFTLLERKASWFLKALECRRFGEKELSFLETVVWKCVKIKADVVQRDEKETKGIRMILNYGHTFAHALETADRYRLPHGRAVAMGMVLAAAYGIRFGRFGKASAARQLRLIQKFGFSLRGKKRYRPSEILAIMQRDKKVKNGRLRLVLPRAIGTVYIEPNISTSNVLRLIKSFSSK